jgi:phosphoribosylaminoimidazolecarboxamide formyltransferase/IMP cyclohydrolase
MSIIEVNRTDDRVFIKHLLVSVSDKRGLEDFIPGLLDIQPAIKIFSTGGTFSRIREILGDRADGRLMQVSDYT